MNDLDTSRPEPLVIDVPLRSTREVVADAALALGAAAALAALALAVLAPIAAEWTRTTATKHPANQLPPKFKSRKLRPYAFECVSLQYHPTVSGATMNVGISITYKLVGWHAAWPKKALFCVSNATNQPITYK